MGLCESLAILQGVVSQASSWLRLVTSRPEPVLIQSKSIFGVGGGSNGAGNADHGSGEVFASGESKRDRRARGLARHKRLPWL